jgi:hypothetical protein
LYYPQISAHDSIVPIDEVCHFPIRHVEHAIHCKELPNFKYRQDFVRDVLFDIIRQAGIFLKALVNFLSDP